MLHTAGFASISGEQMSDYYDVIIVGAGVSGSFIAHGLCRQGVRCLMLEAGNFFNRKTYPRAEIDANSQLYWGGGVELTKDAGLGLLRPKVVGGGSIVNQALLDRFDDMALESWRDVSGVSYLERSELDPYYDRAEAELAIEAIPAQYRNGNARIFIEGSKANGYGWSPLTRAQKNCRYEDGNDCIECLAGCPIDSKQSMPVTVLKKALAAGLKLVPRFEVTRVAADGDGVRVTGKIKHGEVRDYRARNLVMASGAIGNSRLLLESGFGKKLPALGANFYTHPQYMNLGVYEKRVDAHKGPLQSVKSLDPNFRRQGFKLENVFAPPVAISMLVPGFGIKHQQRMKKITHFACIEVAVRDTNPGRISVHKGRAVVSKVLDGEDRKRRDLGMKAIDNIFRETGAKEVIKGKFAIGLHLMGGCNMGTDGARSVVDPDFRLHGFSNIHVADSSIFPNAPGINPSLTVMALSVKAADRIMESLP